MDILGIVALKVISRISEKVISRISEKFLFALIRRYFPCHKLAEKKLKFKVQPSARKARPRISDRSGSYRSGAEKDLRSFFDNPNYPRRNRHLSKIRDQMIGLTDDELRIILRRIGAKPIKMKDGLEGWHLDIDCHRK